MLTYETFSSKETKDLGSDIAKKMIAGRHMIINSKQRSPKKSFVVSLRGELGAGKTTFTQGFFRGLGIKRNPISPTFVIMRHYKMPRSPKTSFTDVYHFDAYRLRKAEDLTVLGFIDMLSNSRNVIIIEWPERIEKVLPKNATNIVFRYGKKENERKIMIKSGFPSARE